MGVIIIFGIALIIIILVFAKKLRRQKKPIPPPVVGFDLSPGMVKFFKWLYFFVSLAFLLLYLLVYSFTISLLIHRQAVEGSFVSTDCSYRSRREINACSDLYKVFIIEYSFKNKNHITSSSGSGVRIHSPSSLINEDLSIGDSVNVFVDSSNPSNSIIAEEFWSTLFFETLYLMYPVLLTGHSTYLLFKMQKK